MRVLFVVCLLLPFTVYSQDLLRYFRKQDSLTRSIRLIPAKDNPSVVAVIRIRQPGWSEKLSVVKILNGIPVWEARFDTVPVESSIRSVRQVRLPGHTGLLFEVYGATHFDNGFYYLYRLEGRTMKLLAFRRAVDGYPDGGYKIRGDRRNLDRVFNPDTLTARYRDVDGDGYADVVLTGRIEIGYNEKIVKAYPARKVLLYNPTRRRFTEDLARRQGFEKGDD